MDGLNMVIELKEAVLHATNYFGLAFISIMMLAVTLLFFYTWHRESRSVALRSDRERR